MSNRLHYTIKPKNLGAHLVEVTIAVPAGHQTLTAKLPKWIPGSYKIRDYSRHVQAFDACTLNGPVPWHKSDSDTWVIETDGQAVLLSYDVYAYDLSVRGAYLDDTRFFFNHCCVCMDITHFSDEKRLIDISTVDDWRIFTALPLNQDSDDSQFYADHYAQQIDCPVESAQQYLHSEFSIKDKRHEVIFTGALSDDYDMDAMTQHLKKICQAEVKLFGDTPLDKYLFMTYLEPKQYGGLEHSNSVAQMASPDMIMKKGEKLTDKMIDFLGLCSHEYFHLWTIKRLQPKDFQPYDLYREQNTEMLWLFEGFTSYYDELFLLRAGTVNAETFLKRQAQNLSRVLQVPGRKLQPLAASSFDAWTKLYQADANSPNHMVSYYSKGAVFALFLDLFLRRHSDGHAGLDNVVRHLWLNYGEKGIGIDEDMVFAACARFLADDKHERLTQIFVEGLHGTDDLPFADLLTDFGVDVSYHTENTNGKAHSSDSGLRLAINDNRAKIAFLAADSHAAEVGVSVDDELLAINHQTAASMDFHQCLNHGRDGETLTLTLSRRGRVFEKSIRLSTAKRYRVHFERKADCSLGDDWLAVWR